MGTNAVMEERVMSDLAEATQDSVFENIRGTRDAISVKRVFGDSYEVEGVTVIPVARVAGGAGGGGGEGVDDEADKGTGFGTGFGIGARPVGVYEVRDGVVEWRPAIDVTRIVKGAQVLAGLATVCLAIVFWRRS